jgi:hypothetical protein
MEPQTRTQVAHRTAKTLARPQVNSLLVVTLFAVNGALAIHGARVQRTRLLPSRSRADHPRAGGK